MRNALRTIFLALLLLLPSSLLAQETGQYAQLEKSAAAYFKKYKSKTSELRQQPKMLSCQVDETAKRIRIEADEYFAAQEFTPAIVKNIYKKLGKALPKPYDKYQLQVVTNGLPIEDLVPNRLSANADKNRLWGDIDYDGRPWVENLSRPNVVSHGLRNRHISIWASHGKYYDQKKGFWKYQRPNLFCTNEDLYTQTIVVPFLIPMLENAGANVFTPRERDWQKNEVIVDNDDSKKYPYYQEISKQNPWVTCEGRGFARHGGTYTDNENPFEAGTARMTIATKKNSKLNQVSYQPNLPEAGRYAVYVSYKTMQASVPDAQYIVCHKGQKTYFRVNQQMGDGTWVYLGTFDFDKGCNQYNRVVVTNLSEYEGLVTTDAVRFGGGMGNIKRGGSVSGVARSQEGARYYAQWAGAPYSVYSSKNGVDDYSDDINARSYMTNWLGGGSVYMPSLEGKHVPIELSLAVHSDAGYAKDGKSIIGSLSICTTNFNDGKLNAGISRLASRDLADALLGGVNRDVRSLTKTWNRRELYDRNYSETRNPEVPSAIIEMLSHQNFPDMRFGQDPNFKFLIARSIYKTIVRYINEQHGRSCVIQPLAPNNFRIEFVGKNKVKLSWNAVADPQEPTAKPTSYNVYTANENGSFNNGVNVKSDSYTVELKPDMLYHFRVTAVNRGGESFPTEILSARSQTGARQTVLIVNGFHRLSAPAVIDNSTSQGFDIERDPGVSYGMTAGWCGLQTCFDKTRMGDESSSGLGYSTSEWAGLYFAGNDFDVVKTHAQAIASANKYNIVSCSSEAIETNLVKLHDYQCVDLALGLEKNDPNALKYYKTFSPQMQKQLAAYVQGRGRLLVSGSYIGADMTQVTEQQFLSKVLKLQYAGSDRSSRSAAVNGMGVSFDIYRTLNSQHYAATAPDIIQPVAPAYCAMQYADGTDAAVAYGGKDYRCFTMGFPLECIKEEQMRNAIMRGILVYLLK